MLDLGHIAFRIQLQTAHFQLGDLSETPYIWQQRATIPRKIPDSYLLQIGGVVRGNGQHLREMACRWMLQQEYFQPLQVFGDAVEKGHHGWCDA